VRPLVGDSRGLVVLSPPGPQVEACCTPWADMTGWSPQRPQALRSRNNKPCRCFRGRLSLPEWVCHPREEVVDVEQGGSDMHMADQAQKRAP